MGNQQQCQIKRIGWRKENAFNVCLISYTLAIQDQSLRRKKWQYLILDKAHKIKNFHTKKWQILIQFYSTNRLLLTNTPLQNNIKELWSFLHFLMPHIFQSQQQFRQVPIYLY